MVRATLSLILLAGCDLPSPDLLAPNATKAPSSASPVASAEPEGAASAAPRAAADGTVTVKNAIGVTLTGEVVRSPPAGSPEATILAALTSQSSSGSFDAFLKFVHPSAKSETLQVDRLRAYTWEQSRGPKAGRCLHEGGTALIVVARSQVNAEVAGGGRTGARLSLWCGEDRMPVPFTLYPDADTHRFTQFGLN
jgi:hypothetical protein